MAKFERTKNASRNIMFGIVLKVFQIVVPFFMRTAMIYIMGVQYLGLNSLFTSVMQVLNLAELGVGSAMIYSMYKPIAEDDHATVCALIKLYRTYYRIIGGVIAAIGIIVTPFIPKLINGDVPSDVDVLILYYLNLSTTVLSYWLFAYKNSVILVFQREDIVSKITLATRSFQYGMQLLVLFIFRNYYLFVIVMLVTQALTNIIISIFSDRLYPQFQPRGSLEKEKRKEINKKILDLFTSRVGFVIYESADTIVVSAFLGLETLAIYHNYFYILSAVSGLIAVIFSACSAAIGNSIAVENKEKNYLDLEKLTLFTCWIAGGCSCCLLCMYQPFMELWVGENLMLNYYAVVCFVVYFFVFQINKLLNVYKDASGIWDKDKFRPLVAAFVNLALNVLLVNIIGIYGVLLSTVVAILCVGMPWLLYNLFTTIFEYNKKIYYLKQLFHYSTVVTISCLLCFVICQQVHANLVAVIICRGLICFCISNSLYYIAFRKNEVFRSSLVIVNKITRGKFEVILRKIGMICSD